MSKTKKVILVIAVIFISGLSGIVTNRYIFPHLATMKFFSKYDFFKKTTEDVTIINKTEQVYVKEDTSINKITNQATSSVVNIISSIDQTSNKKNQISLQPVIKNGTGLIVTSDGLIVTYVEAILTENARYKILTGENIYDATLLDIDSYSNLAFLKIAASNLPVASFGNSDDTVSGEKVIAIGNSSGSYNPFFASGVLSNFNKEFNLTDKSLASSEKLEGVFETDLNRQENYIGGPVIDYSGQVIGLTGMNEKDGKIFFFQIPANKIKLVLEREIKKELNTNPILGIYYLSITKSYSLMNNLSVQSGAIIHSPSLQQGLAIIANSPAANAGLKIGDIIIAVSGEKIEEMNTLPDLLYKHHKGEEIELTILRNTQEVKVKVQL